MKAKEKEKAVELRKGGMSMANISKQLGVSKGSVSLWVRDIELSSSQMEELSRRNPSCYKGGESNRKKFLKEREEYQILGREKALIEDEGYRLGCALYWAEGHKAKGTAGMTSTDSAMLRVFVEFLRKYFKCGDNEFSVNVMAHLNNGLTVDEIHDYWLRELGLPKECVRQFTLKTKYYANVNKKSKRHPYGGCMVRICSTEIVQKIFGSIQEIFKIEREEWIGG